MLLMVPPLLTSVDPARILPSVNTTPVPGGTLKKKPVSTGLPSEGFCTGYTPDVFSSVNFTVAAPGPVGVKLIVTWNETPCGPGQNPVALAVVVSRSEEHTSELQSRGLISYAVFC